MMTRRTKTYLDNNAFQRLSSPGIDLPAALTATGTVLMLGTHVVYELARWFLSPLGYEGAPPLFRVLANLADIDLLDYVPTTDRLIRAEFDRASTGVHIVTVVHPLNKAAFKLELHRLARADTVDAQTFIAKREARRAESQQRSLELIIKASHKLQESRPDAWRRLRAFDAFREFARARDTDYLRQLAAMHRCRTSPAAIRRILDRPGEFPVLSTWLESQIHLMWTAARERIIPASSRFDDCRHLIDSASCDLLVTADARLISRAQYLSPYRPVESWSRWWASVESCHSPTG